MKAEHWKSCERAHQVNYVMSSGKYNTNIWRCVTEIAFYMVLYQASSSKAIYAKKTHTLQIMN